MIVHPMFAFRILFGGTIVGRDEPSTGGNIGITLKGSLNGNRIPTGFDSKSFLPEYENPVDPYDYTSWREGTGTVDNFIRGRHMLIQAGTVGLTAPPQTDVANMMLKLTGTGEHPQVATAGAGEVKASGLYSAMVSVEDPYPAIGPLNDIDARGGGRLETYPVTISHFPDRPGNIQVGTFLYTPEAQTVIPLAVLSSTSFVIFTPQQQAIEELIAKLGGEDVFIAPPLWIDIEMGEEEDEFDEEDFEDDEFSFLEEYYFFGSPDLRNVKNMPTLLGEFTGETDGFLRLSSLR